jgi:hypothetical protein
MTPAHRPIYKKMNTTLRTCGYRTGEALRRECWAAMTTDGLYEFERLEETGIPWSVTFQPRSPKAVTYPMWGSGKCWLTSTRPDSRPRTSLARQ